jgi:TonB family protein
VVTLLVFGYFGLRRHPIQLNPGGAGQSSSSVASDSTASAASSASADSSGAVKNQALPNPSAGALHTIHGHIKIRVRTHVDASGNVIETKFISPGPSRYFARLSQEAAQQWKFTPRTQNGRAVPSDWTIMFEWTRDGIQAFPQQGNSGK